MYLKGYKWLLPQNYLVKNAYWTKHIKPFLKKTKIKWKDVTALNTCTKIKRGFPWLFQKILLMICQTYAMRKKKKNISFFEYCYCKENAAPIQASSVCFLPLWTYTSPQLITWHIQVNTDPNLWHIQDI